MRALALLSFVAGFAVLFSMGWTKTIYPPWLGFIASLLHIAGFFALVMLAHELEIRHMIKKNYRATERTDT